MPTPPLAVIDIGSNSGRVAVLSLTEDGHLEMLSDGRTSLHLIDDVAALGRLSPEAIDRVVRAVHDFLCIAVTAGAERTVAVATAAVREATNGDELARRLLEDTGVTLEIIDGTEEAHYALVGAVHGLAVEDGMLVDIGGGSLEISRFRGREAVSTWSLPLGAGRLTAGFLTSDPPRAAEMNALRDHVEATLQEVGVPVLEPTEQLVGTGGTIRNLAKIHRARITYPIPRMHGYVLDREHLRDVVDQLVMVPLARRDAIPGLSRDRADTVTGGGLAVLTVMDWIQARSLVVSGQGLREGVALEHTGRLPSSAAARRASVAALVARFTTWEEGRASRRRRIAATLLDALMPHVDEDLRDTLDHAALILDVGRSVDYYQRWEHAAAIVVAADLRGFTHRRIALLASTIAGAGGGRPNVRAYAPVLSAADRRPVEQLSVILALADQIERRSGDSDGVPQVRQHDRRRTVAIRLAGCAVWQSTELARRFKRAFGRDLSVDAAPLPGERAS
ncbi:MAG TPA: Ppx/GppA phosphatase family protein [Candidatus Dormibacteraeota bacterium]|nr:Ppx/GppA phosphatase family protein [Candidatus Dormibacteraeota bacterium]